MYVGIDISKNKSNVCILDKNKQVIEEFAINHDKDGFEKLKAKLTPEMKIGLETTGVYCRTLYYFLKQNGYDVNYLENLQMKNYAKMMSPNIKNDVVDARLIARFVSSEESKSIKPIKMDELKDLVKLHQKMVGFLGTFKAMFKQQSNVIFPELETCSSLSGAKGIQDLLLKYPSPKLIRQQSIEELSATITENLSKSGKYNQEYVSKLKTLAKNSVGVEDFPTSCFQYTLKTLQFFESIIGEIRDRMLIKIMETPYFPLLDQHGYNTINAAKIIGEIADIRRFPNHRKFIGYTGLSVSERQSGSSINSRRRITKRGNRILRFTFYMMALSQISSKGPLYPHYLKLKEKGKLPKQALVACARRIAVWTYYEMKKTHNYQGSITEVTAV